MAPVEPKADWPEFLRFLGCFVRSPRTVGAFAPSSRRLAHAMTAAIRGPADRAVRERPPDPARPRHIVELGAGTGALTGAIVERLAPADRFLSVEIEPVFVAEVRRRWPTVDCVCASAESLRALADERGLDLVDHIVSGLPFATLPADTTRRILDAIGHTLRPGGTFTTFHYLQSYRWPPAAAFRRQVTALMASSPSTRVIVGNLPPAVVVSWTNHRPGPRSLSP